MEDKVEIDVTVWLKVPGSWGDKVEREIELTTSVDAAQWVCLGEAVDVLVGTALK